MAYNLGKIESDILDSIKYMINENNDFYVLNHNNGVPEQITKLVMNVLEKNTK